MKILITAGPTREPVDPVRYLTNRSSGKMGYALAADAQRKGHEVLLISGPTHLDIPPGVDFIPVETAAEMHEVVGSYLSRYDCGIFAAAVADYTPAIVPEHKIKKHGERLTLELVKTQDILGSARTVWNFEGLLIGFAAETRNLEEYARGKLIQKGCDIVIANDVSHSDIGFDSDENEVLLVYPGHTRPLPRASKEHLAHHLIEAIEDL